MNNNSKLQVDKKLNKTNRQNFSNKIYHKPYIQDELKELQKIQEKSKKEDFKPFEFTSIVDKVSKKSKEIKKDLDVIKANIGEDEESLQEIQFKRDELKTQLDKFINTIKVIQENKNISDVHSAVSEIEKTRNTLVDEYMKIDLILTKKKVHFLEEILHNIEQNDYMIKSSINSVLERFNKIDTSSSKHLLTNKILKEKLDEIDKRLVNIDSVIYFNRFSSQKDNDEGYKKEISEKLDILINKEETPAPCKIVAEKLKEIINDATLNMKKKIIKIFELQRDNKGCDDSRIKEYIEKYVGECAKNVIEKIEYGLVQATIDLLVKKGKRLKGLKTILGVVGVAFIGAIIGAIISLLIGKYWEFFNYDKEFKDIKSTVYAIYDDVSYYTRKYALNNLKNKDSNIINFIGGSAIPKESKLITLLTKTLIDKNSTYNIVIIAYANSKKLIKEAPNHYISNSELAQARAQNIKSKILKYARDNTISINQITTSYNVVEGKYSDEWQKAEVFIYK